VSEVSILELCGGLAQSFAPAHWFTAFKCLLSFDGRVAIQFLEKVCAIQIVEVMKG
jgi:hypothetical protein